VTISEIQKQLADRGKTVVTRQIYRYFYVCGIKPVGVRQHPRQYPDDSGDQILSYLGFSAQNGIDHARQAAGGVAGSKNRITATNGHAAANIVSMRQLKTIRRKK
jgi:hypothetical protein